MRSALELLAGFCLTSSAAIAAALICARVLRSRASARSAYIAWIIVLLATLIPIRPAARATVTVNVPQPVLVTTAPTESLAPSASTAGTALSSPYTPPAAAPTNALTAPHTAFRLPRLRPEAVVLTVYGLGVLAALAWQLERHFRFMHRMRRWRETPRDGQTVELYRQTCAEMGVRRAPTLYLCRAADTCMVAGLFRPCVLLPDERLNLQELRLVFRHELTHYRRGDLWLKLMQLLARCVHWYNPLIYVMSREMNYACEASCDERVMRGQDLDARTYYSETILAVIRRQTRLRTALSTTFYGGKKGMRNRILTIMDTGRRRLGALILCPVLLVATLFSVAVAGQTPSNSENANVAPLSSLFEAQGEPMDEKTAYEKAVAYYTAVRGEPKTAPELTRYAIEPVKYGNETFDTALVELRVNGGDDVWRVYLTPVTGERVTLTLVMNGIENASAYDENDLLRDNADFERLQSTLPRQAVVRHPNGVSVNYCPMPTSYTMPCGTLLNGAEVTVVGLYLQGNNLPDTLTDARTVYWAEALLPASGAELRVCIPLAGLTFADEADGEAAAPVVGTAASGSATGAVPVYASCGRGANVLTAVAAGEQVTILGQTLSFYHVRTGTGETGFMARENVSLDESARQTLAAAQPASFDAVEPGMEGSADAYYAAVEKLWDAYGDTNEWPLEIKARLTELRQASGMDLELDINVLPGADDLTQAQARAIADAYIAEHFGITADDYQHNEVWYSFSYPADDATKTPVWGIRYNGRAGKTGWCFVKINRQGEVVEASKADYDTLMPSAEERAQMTESVGHYLEYATPLRTLEGAEAEALTAQARALLEALYPDAVGRTDIAVSATECEDDLGVSDTVWKQVVLTVPELDEAQVEPFIVVFRDGQAPLYNENYGSMATDLLLMNERERLEAERGPFVTWTIEQKAAFDPRYYGVPQAGDLPWEQAVANARAYLRENAAMSAADADALTAYVAYWIGDVEYGGTAMWRVTLFEPGQLEALNTDGHVFYVDATTGAVVNAILAGEGNG